jgi:hypothetical protein
VEEAVTVPAKGLPAILLRAPPSFSVFLWPIGRDGPIHELSGVLGAA